MARYKSLCLKKILAKKNSQTKWAPVWAVLRVFGKKKVHPARITTVKRNWRRSRIF